MNRTEMLDSVRRHENKWDIVIIGGGATGIGCAVDAASRGLDVLLLEQHDFGKGTSSRSTKLIHGGVRYLKQGDISLVREALKERGILHRNAPHLVKSLPFIIPVYSIWEKFFYGIGLKIYDLLAGKYGFEKSKILSKNETLKRLPTVEPKNLRGGIVYYDGQFDDSRLLINLAATAVENGAGVLNYTCVFELTKDAENKIDGVKFKDEETGEIFETKANVIINACGAFCDSIRQMSVENSKPIIAPSQGVHIILDKSFLDSDNALMIPKTSDGRVLFAIPWHNSTLIGTTDTPIEKSTLEPQAFEEEINFLLSTAGKYLRKSPTKKDILSVFTGIRPLVKSSNEAKNTAKLSRDYTIEIDESNLLTITGGKWTTYRRMAADAIDQSLKSVNSEMRFSVTENLKIHGYCENADSFKDLAIYGSDAERVSDLINKDESLGEKLHPDLPYTKAEIVWAVRQEMAQTVEDVLARRTRALFLNARAAVEIAPSVARIMANELDKDENWQAEQVENFCQTAEAYLVK